MKSPREGRAGRRGVGRVDRAAARGGAWDEGPRAAPLPPAVARCGAARLRLSFPHQRGGRSQRRGWASPGRGQPGGGASPGAGPRGAGPGGRWDRPRPAAGAGLPGVGAAETGDAERDESEKQGGSPPTPRGRPTRNSERRSLEAGKGGTDRCQVPWAEHRSTGPALRFASRTSVDLVFTSSEMRLSLAELMLLNPVSPLTVPVPLPPPPRNPCAELREPTSAPGRS